MPQTLTYSRYEIDYTPSKSYNPIKYLALVHWDDKIYVVLKSCAICFMLGIAPVQRPVRHKDFVRVEITRRRETPAEERLKRSVKWLNEKTYIRIFGGPEGRLDTITLN